MMDFFEWFVLIIVVLAVFNAEKLPALQKLLQDKLNKMPINDKNMENTQKAEKQTAPADTASTADTDTQAASEQNAPAESASQTASFSLQKLIKKSSEKDSFLSKYTKKEDK